MCKFNISDAKDGKKAMLADGRLASYMGGNGIEGFRYAFIVYERLQPVVSWRYGVTKMEIRNKIKVVFFVEDGCKQEDDEASAHWEPINFQIYSSLFPELIQEAIDQWLADNEIGENVVHEVIFAHNVEHDGGGANVGEHFEPILHERQSL